LWIISYCKRPIRRRLGEKCCKSAFYGDENSDSAQLMASFADGAILQTIATDKDGKELVRNDELKDLPKRSPNCQKAQPTNGSGSMLSGSMVSGDRMGALFILL